MNVANTIIQAVVYSNIWISFGAVCFGLFCAEVLSFELPLFYILFIFSATLFTYNFQRLVKVYFSSSQTMSGPRVVWIKRNRNLVYFMTVLSGLASCFFVWQYVFKVWWLFIVVGFFSLFYVWKLPVLNLNIRSIPGVKIFVLGVTWVLATQVLPFYLFSLNIDTTKGAVFFIGSFLFMVAISIPFDIRDINLDEDRLKTIPQKIGVPNAKSLAIILLFMSTVLHIWVANHFSIGLLLNVIFVSFIIGKSRNYDNELYYSGIADGAFCLLFLLFLLF